MWEVFYGWGPLQQALLATTFTWAVTALGAGIVVFTRTASQKFLDTALGFSAGVMIAASYWSLLAPALELSEGYGSAKWFPPALDSWPAPHFSAWRITCCRTFTLHWRSQKELRRDGNGLLC
jgi:zinc transporter ZupT